MRWPLVTFPVALLAVSTLWLYFVALYASVNVFKWLRTWHPWKPTCLADSRTPR